MPPVRSPRLLALALAAAAALPVLTAPPATAEEAPAAGETVVGELVQGYADPAPSEVASEAHEDEGTVLSWVQSDDGEAVRVPTEDVEDVEVGSTVEVALGQPVVDEAAAEGLEPARDVVSSEVLAAPAPATAPAAAAVNHQVTVVMLQPSGSSRDGTTLQRVVDAVNGPVAQFWAEQTGDAVRLGVVATRDWAPGSAVSCQDPFGLWTEAANRAGWQPAPGRHLLVYVPADSPGCAYGLGTIGTGVASGGMAYVQAPELSLIAHEIGHNLGLGHASQLQCDRAVDGGTCQVSSYLDFYDVMGISWEQVGSLSAPQAALLGVLPPGTAPAVAAGAAPAQLVLAPAGARTGTRAVRLTDADGDEYWLEYRTPTGRDSWLGTGSNWPGLDSGVLLRRAVNTSGDSSLLLDGTPSAPDRWSGDRATALPRGASVTFGDAPFRVTVHQTTGTGACVEVVTGTAVHPMEATGQRLGAVLGAPNGGRVCGLRDGGSYQLFQRGAVYWSPGTGAWGVTGAISGRWAGRPGGWATRPPTSGAGCATVAACSSSSGGRCTGRRARAPGW